jgi:hypothetical protein
LYVPSPFHCFGGTKFSSFPKLWGCFVTDGKFSAAASRTLTTLLTDLIVYSTRRHSPPPPLHTALEQLQVDEAVVVCWPLSVHASALYTGVLLDGAGGVATRDMPQAIVPPPAPAPAAAAAAAAAGSGAVKVWVIECALEDVDRSSQQRVVPITLPSLLCINIIHSSIHVHMI